MCTFCTSVTGMIMISFYVWLFFFFFKQKTAYEMRISDWSSDVCSSDLPHRARNALLLAGGYAPDYQERPLDSPEMAGMKAVVEHVLKGHEPYPALAVDRHWNMVAANAAVALLTQLAAPELFEPPVNVLRVALHPKGLAPHIVHRGEWRGIGRAHV